MFKKVYQIKLIKKDSSQYSVLWFRGSAWNAVSVGLKRAEEKGADWRLDDVHRI